MSDFLQSPYLNTLSNICVDPSKFNIQSYHQAKVVIIIPCHRRHLAKPSLLPFLKQLLAIDFIQEIVMVINNTANHPSTTDEQNLRQLNPRLTCLVENADNTHIMQQRFASKQKLQGKGFAIWLGFGYCWQKYQDNALIVTLDADIQNFTPQFLLTLLFPLVHCGAKFNKAYYSRHSNTALFGRITRLFVFPLLTVLQQQQPSHDLINYLAAFRYSLSGDIALKSELIHQLSLRQDWAYDLGLLVEIYQKCKPKMIFQTEMTGNYQHIHGSSQHLLHMAEDIGQYLLQLQPCDWTSLPQAFHRVAMRYVDQYESLALFNGLPYARFEEEHLVEQLAQLLQPQVNHSFTLPAWEQLPHFLSLLPK